MTTTRLPCTSQGRVTFRPVPVSASRFNFCVTLRKSIACNTFFRFLPSMLRISRHCVAPVASTTASLCLQSSPRPTSRPTSVLYLNSMPSFSRSCKRRITFSVLSNFIEGIPYMSSPPPRSARSITFTKCPARFNCCATARPAGPEPMTATRRPVRCNGGCGLIQPLENPYSIMASSVLLIATGFSLMPSTQASSQGAGHVVPVNSGKLFVSRRRSSARFHSPSCTS
mmetsp:Transcript_72577/g.168150  ORF Transcript_72577/g.168150 Transcript_72577/m.168150 type:complete len:227 (-) Transcript_72577:2070-2750(-)